MSTERTQNLLGALALGLVDVLTETVESLTGYGGGASATLVTLGVEPRLLTLCPFWDFVHAKNVDSHFGLKPSFK